jgi:hypothetical protein
VCHDTSVIGEDTDLLIILLFHAQPHKPNLYFVNKGKNNKPNKCWNIKCIKNCFGESICQRLLFAHAFLGCDTTSRLYGVGKGVALKQLLTKNSMFLTAADVFLNRESATCEIVKAGEQAIVGVYMEVAQMN